MGVIFGFLALFVRMLFIHLTKAEVLFGVLQCFFIFAEILT